MRKEELLKLARQAQERAYCPYSHFRVGAAVLDEQGRVFTGANIENSSYGATCCAERVAIFKAVSEGAKEIKVLALLTDEEDFAKPCGICRQVMSEFASEDFRLLAGHPDGRYLELSLEEILPGAFRQESLLTSTAIQGEESDSE